MSIEVFVPQFFEPEIKNLKSVQAVGATVGACLADVVKQYPQLQTVLFDKSGELHNYLSVYVSGEVAYPDELTRQVHDGDNIRIVNIIAGG